MLHNQIQTYSLNIENKSEAIEVKRMESVFDSMAGAVDLPHRHDYFTIIYMEEAEGVHLVDFKEYELSAQTIFFLSPGQVHQLITVRRPKGWVVNFTREYLIRNGIRDQYIKDVYLFEDYGESPPLAVGQHQQAVFANLFLEMEKYLTSTMNYRLEAVGAVLKLFLIQGNNVCSLSGKELTKEPNNRLLRNFKRLIEVQYHDWHKVGDYSKQLYVTPDHLNKTVKQLTGKTAKEMILHKITMEAKRRLLFSEVSTKELAFNLGFEEPAHFANFFKKYTRETPSQFREKFRTA